MLWSHVLLTPTILQPYGSALWRVYSTVYVVAQRFLTETSTIIILTTVLTLIPANTSKYQQIRPLAHVKALLLFLVMLLLTHSHSHSHSSISSISMLLLILILTKGVNKYRINLLGNSQ